MPSVGWHSRVFCWRPILSFCHKEFNREAIPGSIVYISIYRGDFCFFTTVRMSKTQRSAQTDAKAGPSESAGSAANGLEKQGDQVQTDKEMNHAEEKQEGQKQPSAATTASETENNAAEESMEMPRDLGPPLVDKPEDLIKLHPVYPIWIDKKNKEVI